MAGIALCAVVLSVLRAMPLAVLLAGPLIGALWDRRRGGKGFTGGLIGAVITWACLGLVILGHNWYTTGAIPLRLVDIADALAVFSLYTFGGAVIGLTAGIALCCVRYLATLPERVRTRAQQSASAKMRRPISRGR
jgi:hypothetical protein